MSALSDPSQAYSLSNAALRVGAGVLSSWATVWLSRQVTNLTGQHLGTVLDRVVPLRVQKVFYDTVQLIQTPIKKVAQCLSPYVSKPVLETTVIPVIEEAVYRVGVQKGLSALIGLSGLNTILCKMIGIFCASFMFGMAHHNDLSTDRFISTMIPGIVYGVVQEYGNVGEAILVHAIDNIIVHVKQKLQQRP